MNLFLVFFAGGLLVFELAAFSLGDTWIERLLGNGIPDCIDRTCDDYCPRQLPHVRPVCKTQSDDFTRKKVPCVRAVKCCTDDDYCPKSLPRIQCPDRGPHSVGRYDLPPAQHNLGHHNSSSTRKRLQTDRSHR